MIPRSSQPPYQIFNPSFPPHYLHARNDDVITRQEFFPYINEVQQAQTVQTVIQPRPERYRQRHQRNWPGRSQQVHPRSPLQERQRPPERHANAHRAARWQAPHPYFRNPPGGYNAQIENQRNEPDIYQDINVNNLRAAVIAERTRPPNNQRRVHGGRFNHQSRFQMLPQGGDSSNPSSDDLDNIYALRYDNGAPLPPPPPPPRQLSRVPFHIINEHNMINVHNPNGYRDDMQRILGNRPFQRQNFFRDVSLAGSFSWRKHSKSNSYCYGCNTRLLLCLSSIIVGIGAALMLASLYVAGLM